MFNKWDNLIKGLKSDIGRDKVECNRALKGIFDGTFKMRIAPNVKPQNFKLMLMIKLLEQRDDKAAIIDNSYGVRGSWRIIKHGILEDDLFIFNIFTDQSASKVFQLRRDKWNLVRVEVNTEQNYFSVQANDSGVLKENISGDIRYPPKTELTLGGNKAGCFFLGEICYYGLWET
jgi:hypothetical protein